MSTQEQVAPPWLGVLDRGVLEAAALEQTGRDGYADDRFREPLARFLAAAAEEAQLKPIGCAGLSLDVVRLLSNRLLYEADLEAHPEIADADVSDPVVIAGLPRTGTTKLQRMLGRDPAWQSLYLWRALSPAPLPGPNGSGEDPRVALAEEQSRMLLQMFPGFMAAHAMEAREPEEEVLLMQMTFEARGNGLFYRVPGYLEWLAGRPQSHTYEYLRDILRYLTWQDGGRRGRPWVLKSPPHIGRMDRLFETFPQAQLVICHRDPADAVPSLCGLIEQIRISRGIKAVDTEALGAELLAFCADEWRRNLAQRASVPADQILDVHYLRIVRDADAVIEDIYARRGVTLTDDARTAMAAWVLENPQHRYGQHSYTLERYGLTRESVYAAFADYLDAFPFVLERS